MKRSSTIRRTAVGCGALAIALAIHLPALAQQRAQLQMPESFPNSSTTGNQDLSRYQSIGGAGEVDRNGEAR